MTAVMVQGTSSWAGKSLLATVLCRHFARLGYRVAPFKGQNMANNARVVAGGEIGTAQYLQAIAARVAPDVRMNPVLIKPETETTSQVVVCGQVDGELSALEWQRRPPHLWPAIEQAYESLADEFDLIVIEGAGSPAEINLRDTDLANMRVAALADAPVLLVSDIDRGGSLAHLYGTWALVDPPDRQRIKAFILNRFRGEKALLDPVPAQLERLTGVPTLGVVPMLAHALPDEDGAAPARSGADARVRVAIVRYPTASNLDEFKSLEQVAELVWVERHTELALADLVILPGSKHVSRDLAWLRDRGLDAEVRRHALEGRRVLGICGGLQMLGDCVDSDRDGDGLGLLALSTRLAETKRLVERTEARFADLGAPWSELSGLAVSGYEIRQGHSAVTAPLRSALPDGLGWVEGAVLGVYLHGLLEDPAVLRALFGDAPERTLEDAIESLTDRVMDSLDGDLLDEIVAA